MADPKLDKESHVNWRGTWKRRLLVGTTALIVLGIVAAAAKFNVDARYDTWWEEGRSFEVVRRGEEIPPEERAQARFQLYGVVYYLPPGVHKGGMISTMAAGIICAIIAGVAFLPTMFASDKVHLRMFRNIWIGWLSIGVLVSLIAFVWSFVEYYTSSTVDVDGFWAAGPQVPPPRGVLSIPPFTREGTHSIESWSCQISPIYFYARSRVVGVGDAWLPPCDNAKISRWLTLPLFVMSVVLLVLATVLQPWQSKEAKRADQQMEMAGADDRRASDRTGDASRSSSKSATAV
ncbi:hypothetical protein CBER1_10706 [Cercospora berteroae]|uniref:Uncharacterized protein n=1 Tax=Cercospora berteroae TaxID=357750 RepID=A0A2S6BYE1_9PEZI|nr:hypothetical protein CBER1_10706 [Cercospora berteroae]